MASKHMLVAVVALAAAFLPGLAVASEHVVGDDKGWTLQFNYTAWSESRQFVVGDTLLFKYGSSAHNVVEVGGADFMACTKPPTANTWSTGEDRVTLDKAGRRWFICDIGEHCEKGGMKFKVTVNEAGAPSPNSPPAPSNPAGKVHAKHFGVAAVTALAAAALVL
ncbi:mavicyanin [Brachypodium distachyon]|uniref:Phytocyanin domain-containing protein n=1 Tax=Brachypodium distachyon TaxID=15368 RepID=I1GME0_BRADI|nr:mavicyanin [Brachypodium distachyon]KQK12795.1 hypothetical protein BRADI_1g06020v3 [Brachypodium distachyon]|eukprot:XP_003559336.1 mavicyanin [Brachypodium distachyon]